MNSSSTHSNTSGPRSTIQRTGPSPTTICRLLPSDDGWSLLSPDNRILHRGLGTSSRRECLRIARGLGVLTVLS